MRFGEKLVHAIVGTVYLASGLDEVHGLDVFGRSAFRSSLGSAIQLLRASVPAEFGRLSRYIGAVCQSSLTFYEYRHVPRSIFVRYHPEYSAEDWAGFLVHAAVHCEQLAEMTAASLPYNEAARAILFEEEFCIAATMAEMDTLSVLGVEFPAARVRNRNRDLHTFFRTR